MCDENWEGQWVLTELVPESREKNFVSGQVVKVVLLSPSHPTHWMQIRVFDVLGSATYVWRIDTEVLRVCAPLDEEIAMRCLAGTW